MKTILVVEDDRQYRTILDEELRDQNFKVLTAENGKVALELVEKEKIDLILLDLLMPEVDGTSFYYQLKNKLQKKIPIIILTNITDTAAYDHNYIKAVLIKSNTSLEDVIKKVKSTV